MHVAMLSIHSSPFARLGGKEAGGMNVYVHRLSCALGSMGIVVDIYTRALSKETAGIAHIGAGVRVISLHIGPDGPCDKYELLDHVPALSQAIVTFAASEQRAYDIIHSNYWISGAVALDLSAQWHIPIVHMAHTLGAMKNLVAQVGEDERPCRLRIEQQIFAQADAIVAATPQDAQDTATHYTVIAGRMHVIPCGVDVTWFTPGPKNIARRWLGLSTEQQVLLFVGRIEPLKGIETLVRALHTLFQEQPHRRFTLQTLIVGGESERNVAQWSAEQHRLGRLRDMLGLQQNIVFTGAQSHRELPSYYRAADIVTIPSRYESFGMVALEAMACGTPVVAANVGGLSRTIQHAINGLLYPTADHQLLSCHLATLLENEEYRMALASQGYISAQSYGWMVIGERIRELYRSTEQVKQGSRTQSLLAPAKPAVHSPSAIPMQNLA